MVVESGNIVGPLSRLLLFPAVTISRPGARVVIKIQVPGLEC